MSAPAAPEGRQRPSPSLESERGRERIRTDLAPEDAARADSMRCSPGSGTPVRMRRCSPRSPRRTRSSPRAGRLALPTAWRQLQAAAAAADPEAARMEHDALFVGTGKAEVTPYASHYLTETARERLLVRCGMS